MGVKANKGFHLRLGVSDRRDSSHLPHRGIEYHSVWMEACEQTADQRRDVESQSGEGNGRIRHIPSEAVAVSNSANSMKNERFPIVLEPVLMMKAGKV